MRVAPCTNIASILRCMSFHSPPPPLPQASTPLSLQLQPGSSTTGSTTGSTACMICTEAELEEAVQHAVEAALLDSNLKLKLQV